MFDVNSLGGKLIDNQELKKLIESSGGGSSGGGSSGGGMTHFWFCKDCEKDVYTSDYTTISAEYTGHLFKTKPTPTFGERFELTDHEGNPSGQYAWEVTWSGGDDTTEEELKAIQDDGKTFSFTHLIVDDYAEVGSYDSYGNHIITGENTGNGYEIFSFIATSWNPRDWYGNSSIGCLYRMNAEQGWAVSDY